MSSSEEGPERNPRLLHASTAGYVAVEPRVRWDGIEGPDLELVDSTVWPDVASAQEAVGVDGGVTVMALMSLELFEAS